MESAEPDQASAPGPCWDPLFIPLLGGWSPPFHMPIWMFTVELNTQLGLKASTQQLAWEQKAIWTLSSLLQSGLAT